MDQHGPRKPHLLPRQAGLCLNSPQDGRRRITTCGTVARCPTSARRSIHRHEQSPVQKGPAPWRKFKLRLFYASRAVVPTLKTMLHSTPADQKKKAPQKKKYNCHKLTFTIHAKSLAHESHFRIPDKSASLDLHSW